MVIGVDPGVNGGGKAFMNNIITIIIPGRPIAKQRPRFVRRGNFIMAYNNQETEEGRWTLEAKSQIKKKLEGPIDIDICFYMLRPKNHFGSGKRQKELKSSAPAWHTSKPDLDNLLKFCLDCLNGLAWDDDRQIISVIAKKVYGEPRTWIQIKD